MFLIAINKKYKTKLRQLRKKHYLCTAISQKGGLAQLARALAWHARGHRFEPDILHQTTGRKQMSFFPVFRIY